MNETLALASIVVLVGVVLFLQGWYAIMNRPKNTGGSGLSRGQQDDLRYVRQLLVNYRAAHTSSPLTEIEIEEVLRLCEEKVGEVLSC